MTSEFRATSDLISELTQVSHRSIPDSMQVAATGDRDENHENRTGCLDCEVATESFASEMKNPGIFFSTTNENITTRLAIQADR
jgi:hypothetical protein